METTEFVKFKKYLLLLLLMFAGSLNFFAQNTVKGLVTDENGEGVVGATIYIVGTSNNEGTVTDVNGNFVLHNVKKNAVLQVSYIGYKTQQVKVDGKKELTISMTPDDSQLDEVVVVGYGTQKKGNLTTAISTIKGDEVLTTKHTSLAQRLEGKVPGLQIRQNSGSPGDYDSMMSNL